MINVTPIGRAGLNEIGGKIHEEVLHKLKGPRGVKAFTEMSDNDSIVGAILFAITMLTRQSSWYVEPVSNDKVDMDAAQFLDECMNDMSMTWEDVVSEILSMLTYGWAYFEIIYKYRRGDSSNPKYRSKHTDGKIGWRKFALRSQDSLDRWEFDPDGGVQGMWQIRKNGSPVLIPIDKALLFRTRVYKNNPEGRSILRNAYVSYYYVKRIQELEAIGIERDLAGLPKLEVPPRLLMQDASPEDKTLRAQLETLVQEVRRDEREGLVLPAEIGDDGQPTGFKFSLVSTGGQRQIDTSKIITRYEQRIAMTVLAEFIMMGLEKGSYSAVVQKNFMFSTALDAWLDSIASVFNMFAVPRLFELNGWSLEELPRIEHTPVQQISLEELGGYIERLSRAGMPLFPDPELETVLRQRADLPEPSEDLSWPSTWTESGTKPEGMPNESEQGTA